MNLQNLPRNDKTVKKVFVPKLDCFLFADYSSIEYRLLAYYCSLLGDDSIAREFRSGLDPHSATAARLFLPEGSLIDSVTEEQRQIGKTLNYSVIYLGGENTIMKQLGISYPEAKALLTKFHKTRPGIRMLDKELIRVLRGRGYIKTIAGRQLHPKQERLTLNCVLQGGAAELIRDAMRNTHQYLRSEGYKTHLISCVHDELGFDCDQDEVIPLAKELPRLMGNEEIEKIVPITVDLKYSETNWGEAEGIEIDE